MLNNFAKDALFSFSPFLLLKNSFVKIKKKGHNSERKQYNNINPQEPHIA